MTRTSRERVDDRSPAGELPVADSTAAEGSTDAEPIAAREPIEAEDTRQASRPVTFTVSGARDGFLACLPIAIGVASYGIVFGMLAVQAGLSVAEAAVMSATVLAGAAQLLAVDIWMDAATVPVAAVVLATLLVNLRYVVMGAALRPWLESLSPLQTYGSVFFTADENWALTMGTFTDDEADRTTVRGAYLLGSGLAIWSFWVAATIVGAVAGDGIGQPSRYGLDVVFLAVFVAIAVDLWDGKTDLRPWATAFVVALGSAHALPGQWYVLLGALAGCVVGVAGVDPAESEAAT